jgi:hypothetical protein
MKLSVAPVEMTDFWWNWKEQATTRTGWGSLYIPTRCKVRDGWGIRAVGVGMEEDKQQQIFVAVRMTSIGGGLNAQRDSLSHPFRQTG